MKVLLLGNSTKHPLRNFLEQNNAEVVLFADKLKLDFVKRIKADFLVSYGYRHIIRPEVLTFFDNRAINLHISMLPFNRGADPNLWSFLEKTPSGVSIHLLDKGVDTGDILFQKKIEFDVCKETLYSSYKTLSMEIENLFKENFSTIVSGKVNAVPQKGKATVHSMADKEPYLYLLTKGWDTPVDNVWGKAL
jgi:methionyl-tRNA formyltransferase